MLSACFHCGLPVFEPGRHRVALAGVERELCCAGCEAVARTIAAAGLEGYYETRTGPAPTPADLPRLPVVAENTCEAALILDRVRCAACLWLIEKTLARLPGITRAEVNYATQRAHLSWDPQKINLTKIVEAIRAVGYDAYPYDPQRQEALERRSRRAALWRLFVAGFGAMQVMMYAFPAYIDDGALTPDAAALMRWASLLLTLPVLLISCGPFFAGARQELRLRRIGLDTPIALGIACGFAGSTWATVSGHGEVYFDSISMLVFLLLGARYLEAAARRRAARALDPLLRCTTNQGLVVNQEISIAAGERVPADGIVLSGRSSAGESLLTGESRPVAKAAGAELIAGSVNLEQPLVMRVTRVGADTRAAAIARLVERGAASRPRLVDAAERAARLLTYVIVLTAASAGIWFGNPWIAVAVLVVACPCALALAAPLVLTRAGTVLLARGVLLTRGRALDALDRATDAVLDKTGTLTTGRLALVQIQTLGPLGADACFQLAAALEAGSLHPIARVFSNHRSTPIPGATHVPGRGIEAGGVRIGSEAFCRELVGAAPPGPTNARAFLADARGWLGAFELQDEVRADAQALIDDLKARGIRLHLASGDAQEAVAAMARRLGIERFAGGMTPQDKFDYVARLQAEGRVVVMIGDGLNDAPVLARADASFALGCGADAAQLSADLVVINSSLRSVARVFDTARRSMRLVRQNLGWALAYNALALPLAAAGWIGPWEAALAMGASSLSVLLNALRQLDPGPAWKASTSSYRSPSPSYS